MHEVNLGQLPGPTAKRDAIHIAVAPVVAGEKLKPGDRVKFAGDDGVTVAKAGAMDTVIGIIDPFLSAMPIKKGTRCYILLMPNTITSLRHEWTHPAFVAAEEKSFSEQWLRVYAKQMNCSEDEDTAYATLIEGLQCGELFAHGSDLHNFGELHEPEELRHHAETVLGIRLRNWEHFTFSCSC